MAYLFRGRDRRLLLKAMKTLKAIVKRDELALNTTKKSTRFSTRTLILDADSTEGGYLFDANTLIIWLNAQRQQMR